MTKIFVLFPLFFILVSQMIGQSNVGNNIPDATFRSCEEFSARVDAIRSTAKDSGEKIFVIFHAGKNETEIVNSRRMAYVRDFLRSDIKLWNELDVIYARGEKSSEAAVIAFYLGGKLIEAMSAPRNKTPCMDCCEARYYTSQSLLKPISFKSVRARDNRRTSLFR